MIDISMDGVQKGLDTIKDDYRMIGQIYELYFMEKIR